MKDNPPGTGTVRVTHRFSHPPGRVFDAFLDPATARHWLFATATGTIVRAEIEPRVGGTFVFVDRRPTMEVEHRGTWVVLERPRRIVFTFTARRTVDPPATQTTQVEVELQPEEGGGCLLVLVQKEVPPDQAPRAQMGWEGVLAGLHRQLG